MAQLDAGDACIDGTTKCFPLHIVVCVSAQATVSPLMSTMRHPPNSKEYSRQTLQNAISFSPFIFSAPDRTRKLRYYFAFLRFFIASSALCCFRVVAGAPVAIHPIQQLQFRIEHIVRCCLLHNKLETFTGNSAVCICLELARCFQPE